MPQATVRKSRIVKVPPKQPPKVIHNWAGDAAAFMERSRQASIRMNKAKDAAKKMARARAAAPPAVPEPRLTPYRLEGYGFLFGVDTSPRSDYDGMRLRAGYGAFRQALFSGGNIQFMVNHKSLVSDTESGNLRLKETVHGLHFQLDIPETERGRELIDIVRNGKARGLSISFNRRLSRSTVVNHGLVFRTLWLDELSLIASPTDPCMTETRPTLRLLKRSGGGPYYPLPISR